MYIDDDYDVESNQQRFLAEINFHAAHILGNNITVEFVDAGQMDIPSAYIQPNYKDLTLKINRAVALPMASYELSRMVMDSIYHLHFFKWFHFDLMN